jgi:ATP-dependent Clp protease ATP-binding subunit ClpA
MDDRCSKQLGSQASATTDNLEDVVQSIRGSHTATDQSPHGASAFLETSGRDLTKAVELEYGTLAKLHKKLAAKEVVLDASCGDKTLLREEVTEDDIAEVIAQWARTSLAKPVESEMGKPLQLKEELHPRVIGPDQSVTAVADAIKRSLATRTVRSPASSSSAPRVWAKPSSPRPWSRNCLIPRSRWCASTGANASRSTP